MTAICSLCRGQFGQTTPTQHCADCARLFEVAARYPASWEAHVLSRLEKLGKHEMEVAWDRFVDGRIEAAMEHKHGFDA